MTRKRVSREARRALGVHRRIREAREAAGIAIEQMAAWLNIHPSVYYRTEAGEVGISVERIAEIAQLLHTTVGALLGEEVRAG